MSHFPDIYPVLSCNDASQHFWPVSRNDSPKHFAKMGNAPSLFQSQVKILNNCGFRKPTVVAPFDHQHILRDQLAEAGQEMFLHIAEPEPRNTAAAFCAAAEAIGKLDPNAILMMIMSETIDLAEDDLTAAVRSVMPLLRDDQMVVLGARPRQGAQRRTFVELAQGMVSSTTPQPIAQIIHDPDRSAAQKMLETDRYLWSADIVLASVKTLRAFYGRSAAPIRATVRRAVRESVDRGTMIQLGECYAAVDDSPFETSILEHHGGYVAPVGSIRDSVDDWYAVWASGQRDNRGIMTLGNAMAFNCDDSLLWSDTHGMQVVGLGLNKIAVIATQDAVLVADLDHLDALPRAVKTMQRQDIAQAFAGQVKKTPWGSIETLQSGPRHKVRTMTIKAGNSTQTLSHVNRTETWVVIEGTGRIVSDGMTTLLRPNETLTIPTGRDYRIENPGKAPLTLIEVITGPYLGDDDAQEIETGLPEKETV